MSFLWNWMSSKNELEQFELSKTNFVKYAIQYLSVKNDEKKFPEWMFKTEMLNILLPEIAKMDKKLLFENHQEKLQDWFEQLKKNNVILIYLLILFSDELLGKNWNKDWELFVSGKEIPHPFNLYIHLIYDYCEELKPVGLINRFDFHKYWDNQKNFMTNLKDMCCLEKKHVISVEELKDQKNNLRFTTVQKRKTRNVLQEEIEKTKMVLRKRN
jgi:hypothetical protein